MGRHCPLLLLLIAVPILWCSTEAATSNKINRHAFPEALTESYRDPYRRVRNYMVQEPENLPNNPNILIYMHGSAGREEQGMDPVWARGTFARLRTLLNRWGWVYVCPRDAEFRGLLRHLRDKYDPRDIYLAGASGGGNVALWEAENNSVSYAGLLLLCPAIAGKRGGRSGKLTMPVWIVSADKDRKITRKCRELAKKLKALRGVCFYREIAGGHHGTPLERVDWQRALEFLQEKKKEVVARLPITQDTQRVTAPLEGNETAPSSTAVP